MKQKIVPRLELSCADGVKRRIKQRAMALRLNADGWNVPQIAAHLDWHEHTVRQTWRRWQQYNYQVERFMFN